MIRPSWLWEFSGKPLFQQQGPNGKIAFALEAITVAAGFKQVKRDGHALRLTGRGEVKTVTTINEVVRSAEEKDRRRFPGYTFIGRIFFQRFHGRLFAQQVVTRSGMAERSTHDDHRIDQDRKIRT